MSMRRLLPAISLLALLACSGKPEFTYDVRPGAQVEALRTIAFDPREVAWVSEGQRPARAESLKRLVQETLEAQGFRLVAPEAADMWVDVIAMKPDKGGGSRGTGKTGASAHGGGRWGGGKSGGGMRGGQGAERDRTTHPAADESCGGNALNRQDWRTQNNQNRVTNRRERLQPFSRGPSLSSGSFLENLFQQIDQINDAAVYELGSIDRWRPLQILVTLVAWGPFWPWPVSKLTR
jgi:hypothetical protein